MAGTTQVVKRAWLKVTNTISAVVSDPFYAFYTQINNVVTDLETLRAATGFPVLYQVEDLAAGADISARAIFQAKQALTILDDVVFIPAAASVGVDGSNTLVITLRNITEGVDIATVTRTTDLVANTPIALTLTAANADVASADVLGIVVTQGATADTAGGSLQFRARPQTVDAAADLVASALTDTL